MTTLTETIHQLLKMLEEYSTGKGVLFTRKRKKKAPKKSATSGETEGPLEEEEHDESDEAPAKFVEREFRFSSIEAVGRIFF